MLYANPSFRELLAIPADDELVGRDMLSLVRSEDRDRVEEWIRKAQTGRAPACSHAPGGE